MARLVGQPDGDRSAEGVFNLVDRNGDGNIDRAELTNRKMAVFFLHDQDQDSRLSHEEFDGIVNDQTFAAFDSNGDGFISGFEFNQSELTKFETVDANGDNSIIFEEFDSFRIDIDK